MEGSGAGAVQIVTDPEHCLWLCKVFRRIPSLFLVSNVFGIKRSCAHYIEHKSETAIKISATQKDNVFLFFFASSWLLTSFCKL
jgi:hypothetical protein